MGFPIVRKDSFPYIGLRDSEAKSYGSPDRHGRGWRSIFESYTGAWQENVEIRTEDVLSNHAVFACNSLISGDIAKARLMVTKQSGNIWAEDTKHKYAQLLRKPNTYQNRIQFIEHWVLSKLIFGNTYVLKSRGKGNRVTGLYILHPDCVQTLVADDGEVFYRLSHDKLSKIRLDEGQVTVPASEIIHDRFNCLYHPLVGVSPIYAAGLPAIQALNIQKHGAKFFENRSQPGGLLIAPTRISEEDAASLKSTWETNFSGQNAGKIAVLGNDLKFVPLAVNAVDAQLIEQLKWSAEIVASVYHVPAYMIGAGEAPKYDNINALSTQYYTQCLQILIEALEMGLHDGLGLPESERIEVNLQDLIRMDTGAKIKAASDGVGSGIVSPNEARADFNRPPVPGGQYPYMQQQNYSLEDLQKLRQREAEAAEAPEPDPEPEIDNIKFLAELNENTERIFESVH